MLASTVYNGVMSKEEQDSFFDELLNKEKEAEREWLEVRRGKFTASMIHKLFTKGLALSSGKVAKDYLFRVAAQRLGAMPEQISSASLRWGKDHENEAIQYLRDEENFAIEYWGMNQVFVTHPEFDFIGATTDGIAEDTWVVEQKCPYAPSEHLKNLKCDDVGCFKRNHPDYYIQVQVQMMCNEKDLCLFSSYDPRFEKKLRLKVIEVEADREFQGMLIDVLSDANEQVKEIIKEIV